MSEDHVWVIDTRTGHGYPLAKSVAEGDPIFRIDPKHPVRDRDGRLLGTKYAAAIPAAQAPAPTTTTKGA